jgi:hypothetical protein
MPNRVQPPVQVATIPAPQTVGEAVAALHGSAALLADSTDRLVRFARLTQQAPEMRTVVINPANNGQYQVMDRSSWAAKSIGILNPGSAPVFVGIGGVSARTTSRAPSCPGGAALVLPQEAHDIELGCDPAILGANTAVVYVFRYVTLQPLSLTAG